MSPAIPEEKEQRNTEPQSSLTTSDFSAWSDLISEMAEQLTRKDLSHILADVCQKPAL